MNHREYCQVNFSTSCELNLKTIKLSLEWQFKVSHSFWSWMLDIHFVFLNHWLLIYHFLLTFLSLKWFACNRWKVTNINLTFPHVSANHWFCETVHRKRKVWSDTFCPQVTNCLNFILHMNFYRDLISLDPSHMINILEK